MKTLPKPTKRTLVFFLLLVSLTIKGQQNFRAIFYNVENLFDIKNDSLKNDEDFLPNGLMKWTSWKYWEKLKNITRVITAIGGMQSPALVGMCEIENDSVIFDLTRKSPLRAQHYEFLTTNSPDMRGIDVALLYQRDQFKLLQKTEYKIIFSSPTRPTRNILHAVGQLINSDTLDVFVCHFPSRSGGQLITESARMEAASLLRQKTDSLFSLRKNAHILIMGDFNDHPNNKSLLHILKARPISTRPKENKLYNLFLHHMKEQDFGSYKYKGNWEILDQFIVSGDLLKQNHSIHTETNQPLIFKPSFLLQDDEKYGGKRPYRTNLGPKYIGGFSDHLPVYIDFIIQ